MRPCFVALRTAGLVLALASVPASRGVTAPGGSGGPAHTVGVAPLPLERIQVGGEWRARLELAGRHLMDPAGRFRVDLGWGVDQSARWIAAVDGLARALGDTTARRAADAAFDSLLARQQPDGSFGLSSPTPNAREWWGETRVLLLLTDRLAQAPADSALRRAALRLGQRFLAADVLPAGPDTVVQAGPLPALEGLVALFRLTGERRFREGALRYAAACDTTLAPPGAERLVHGGARLATMYTPARLGPFRRGQHQAHTWLEVAQALPGLAAVATEGDPLAVAEVLQRRLISRSMWVSGGMPEVLGESFEHNDETCAAVSWLRLNLGLFRATGQARYLDVAELVLHNHLSFDQSAAGGFCTDRSLSTTDRVHPTNKGGVADECCSMSGTDGWLQALGYAVTAGPARVDVNFFVNGAFALPGWGAGAPLRLEMRTTWPDSGRVVLRVAAGQPARPFTLRVRRPGWLTAEPTWRINGAAVRPRTDSAGYLTTRRTWQPGDSLEIAMPFVLTLVASGENGFNAAPLAALEPGQEGVAPDAALRYGPLVLMVDRVANSGLKAADYAVALFLDERGRPTLPRARAYMVPGDQLVRPRAHFTSAAREAGTGIEDAAGGGASLGGADEAPWRRITLIPMSELTTHPRLVNDTYRVRHDFVLMPRERAEQILPQMDR